LKLLTVAWIGVAAVALAATTGWNPDSFREEQTLDFLTVAAEEGEHWSRVWLVVIDGQLYIRLGPRAAGRIEKNTAAPYVRIRIAGQELDHVRVEPAPGMAGKVAAALADKYWSDVLIHHFSHPLTARLVAEPTRANR
jgi:hypothetical protein